MNKTRSLIRETIIKLLEEDTKFNEGDAVQTSEGDKGIVTLAKHPFYAVKLDNTGTTHSYHFTDIMTDPEAEEELDFGKYDVSPEPEEQQPEEEIKEIKIGKPAGNIIIKQEPYPGTTLIFSDGYKINGIEYSNKKYSSKKLLGDKIITLEGHYDFDSNKLDDNLTKYVKYLRNYNIPYVIRKAKLDNTARVDVDITKIFTKQELQESSPSDIIHMEGLLTVYEELNVTDVLSDIRSIPGITVVRPIDIPGETHKNKLAIKIDPYPFKGSDEASIKNQIKISIRRVPGVKEFFTNVAPIQEIKFRIKDPQ